MIDLQDLYYTDPVKACRIALRRTVKADPPERLELIDKLLGAHGVEPLYGEWVNGYWCDVAGGYVNMGDPYALTVVELRTGSGRNDRRFIVTTWGDLVERFDL